MSNSLPHHPVTGLMALGFGKRGPIWPQLGASEDNPEPEPQEPEGEPEPDEDKPEKADPHLDKDPDTKGFVPPASQEEFDRLVNRRVAREAAKYSGYDGYKKKAAEFDKLQDSKKSAEERLTSRLADIEKENAELKLDKLRSEIASAKGLPPKFAKRLTGATCEEMEADADDLLDTIPKPPEPKVTLTQKPKENLRGGGRPDEEPEETDPTKLAARIRRR